MTMREAFGAVVADRSWFKKTAIGVGITMIPYVGMFWFMGYGFAWVRDAAWDDAAQLPEWQPVGARFKTGLIAFVVSLVYSLPVTVLAMGATAWLAIRMAAAIAAGSSMPDALWPLVVFVGVLTVVFSIYGIAVWPVYAQVALYDSIESGFDVRRIFQRAREHAPALLAAGWRALLISLLSSVLVMGGMVVIIGGVVVGIATLLPDEIAGLAWLLIMPAQILASVLTGFVSVFSAFVSYRLWAGYARTAYGLGDVVPATAPVV